MGGERGYSPGACLASGSEVLTSSESRAPGPFAGWLLGGLLPSNRAGHTTQGIGSLCILTCPARPAPTLPVSSKAPPWLQSCC